MRTFADTLKKEREESGLSQTELGQKLNCSRYRIADLERGRIAPTIEDLNLLCDLFSVSSDYLIGRTDIKTTQENTRMICEYTGLSESSVSELNKQLTDYSFRTDTAKYILTEIFPSNPFEVLDYFLSTKAVCPENFFDLLKKIADCKNAYIDLSKTIETDKKVSQSDIFESENGYPLEDFRDKYQEFEERADYSKWKAQELFRVISDSFINPYKTKAMEDFISWSNELNESFIAQGDS